MSFLLQILVLGLFTLYFFVFSPKDIGRQDSSYQQEIAVAKPRPPAQVMKEVLLTEFQSDDEGQKEWVLDAQSALSDSFEQSWQVLNSRVSFFKNNSEVVRIHAKRGWINTESRNLNLEQDVLGEAQNGYVFKTSELSYNSLEEKFTSDTEVYFESPGRNTQIRGSAMVGLIAPGTMQIAGPIKCEQQIEGYKRAVIQSDSAVMSLHERNMNFNDNLFIQMDDINITGQSAEFIYAKGKADLEMLRIKGKVFVSSGNDRSASADRLEIRLKEDLFLFQGSPRFVSGENVLVGNEIVLYDKGRRVQVLKGQVKSEAPESALKD